jgi:radical SAM family uncharacterized protein
MKKQFNEISHWELLEVDKPARYLGGEVNQAPLKENPKLKVCLAFPDLYELAMSNLAIKILYETLNKDSRIQAERVFSPWVDFEELLRKKEIDLYSLESKTPINQFDLIGVTLPYEMTFTNVLNLLELGDIPLKWSDRESGPFIVAGGPSAANPLPISAFMDAVVIGDGEEVIHEICEVIMTGKKNNASRSEIRKELSKLEGVWVPEFPGPVRRRVFLGFKDQDPPLNPIVPNVQAIHNRAPIEIFRGCVQGCRFCNAGFYYRPKRERSVKDLLAWSKTLLENTGEESLGLLSLSTSDYSCLDDLIRSLDSAKVFEEQTVSIPSMRMNENTLELLSSTPHIRKGGLTFAPEAGTQKLRDIINKNITEEDIIQVIEATKGSTYRTLKLYFMMGLPFETDEDLEGIVELVSKLESISKQQKPKKQISISLSGFVPKPFTPFQWAPQASMEEFKRKRQIVRNGLDRKKAKISWREEYLCMLEGVLSRGDEKICDLLIAAHKQGCKFDGWNEHFDQEKWDKAFEESNIKAEEYLKDRPIGDKLPWDFVDFRVPREFLEKEYRHAASIAGEDLK